MIYLELFLEFFKIGLFTIGGGYAMIPLVKELVITKGWMAEELFYDFIGVCESTPGPIAVNMATYVGSSQGGILGALCSTLGVVLPSFIIIVLVCVVLEKVIKSKQFKRIIEGIKPVVIALIMSTGLILFCKAIGYVSIKEFNFNLKSLIIGGLLLIVYFGYKLIFKKKFKTIPLILLSALLGILVNLIL